MIASSEANICSLHTKFIERACALGIACWSVDSNFALDLSPLGVETVSAIDVIAAAVNCRQAKSICKTALNASNILIAFPDETGAVVAIINDSTEGLARNQLVEILTNYHFDLSLSMQSERAIQGFNAQLSHSYEEVNLIFHMSKFLASSQEPRLAIKSMCDELRAVLNYGWVAAVFNHSNAVLEDLRAEITLSGSVTFPLDHLRSSLTLSARTKKVRVLEPANSVLAQQSGAEILCAQVNHGDTLIGTIVAGNRLGVDPDVSSNEIQLIEATVGFLELFHQNAFRFAEQRLQFLGTLHALSAAVDAKDPYTHGHSERVGWLASQLARALGYDCESIEATRVAGLLHDIGKIGVPEAILTKPARLSDDEFNIIRQHPVIGHNILSKLPSLSFQLPGVLHHHERWDGQGYPHQLKGEAIPEVARILSFADTFDAMSSNRAYRSALTRSRVLEEICHSAGSQFDPDMIEAFTSLDFTQFDLMLESHKPELKNAA